MKKNIAIVTLVKKATNDGLIEMRDHVALGKKYRVDLDSKKMVDGYNYKKNQWWRREIIFEVDGMWLPTELLKIEDVSHDDEKTIHAGT